MYALYAKAIYAACVTLQGTRHPFGKSSQGPVLVLVPARQSHLTFSSTSLLLLLSLGSWLLDARFCSILLSHLCILSIQPLVGLMTAQ